MARVATGLRNSYPGALPAQEWGSGPSDSRCARQGEARMSFGGGRECALRTNSTAGLERITWTCHLEACSEIVTVPKYDQLNTKIKRKSSGGGRLCYVGGSLLRSLFRQTPNPVNIGYSQLPPSLEIGLSRNSICLPKDCPPAPSPHFSPQGSDQ